MGYQITDCERNDVYRYSLSIKTGCASQERLVVIQCNPSIANEGRSDPTAGKVAKWAEENSFGEVILLNLFAYISPYKSDLSGKEYSVLVGPENNDTLNKYISRNSTVVLAWGGDIPVEKDFYLNRLKEIRVILDCHVVTPHKVGNLSYGTHPRHGRMWNKGNRKLSTIKWEEIIV